MKHLKTINTKTNPCDIFEICDLHCTCCMLQ